MISHVSHVAHMFLCNCMRPASIRLSNFLLFFLAVYLIWSLSCVVVFWCGGGEPTNGKYSIIALIYDSPLQFLNFQSSICMHAHFDRCVKNVWLFSLCQFHTISFPLFCCLICIWCNENESSSEVFFYWYLFAAYANVINVRKPVQLMTRSEECRMNAPTDQVQFDTHLNFCKV